MRLDNSQLVAYNKCPLFWQERYISKIQKPAEWAVFGMRWHQLMEEHMKRLAGFNGIPYPALNDEALENEAQMMLSQYMAKYPVEPFEVIDVEKTFELPLLNSGHTYTGKFDAVVRDRQYNWLQIFESKSEKRNSPRNHPKAWNARSQVSLYKWAAEQIYGEKVENIILNVCTRPSDSGKLGPDFRRDLLERSEEQLIEALRNLIYVANQIEYHLDLCWFPRNTESCMEGRWECDYYNLHNVAETGEDVVQIRKQLYVPAEQYLDL